MGIHAAPHGAALLAPRPLGNRTPFLAPHTVAISNPYYHYYQGYPAAAGYAGAYPAAAGYAGAYPAAFPGAYGAGLPGTVYPAPGYPAALRYPAASAYPAAYPVRPYPTHQPYPHGASPFIG